MMAGPGPHKADLREVMGWIGPIIGPDRNFFWLSIIYGVGISLLSLATPISVQLLINSIANTALPTPLFTLSALLLFLLLVSGALGLMRTYMMELFRRRFMARLVADITMRAINAANPFFADNRRIDLFNRYFEIINIQKRKSSFDFFGSDFWFVIHQGKIAHSAQDTVSYSGSPS
jgi:putative ABC transport system ATP-binding protein